VRPTNELLSSFVGGLGASDVHEQLTQGGRRGIANARALVSFRSTDLFFSVKYGGCTHKNVKSVSGVGRGWRVERAEDGAGQRSEAERYVCTSFVAKAFGF